MNGLVCPFKTDDYPIITLAHGAGGKLTQDLIESIFQPAFDNKFLNCAHDGAMINFAKGRHAITTDSYVVQPIFFPGGDIGKLAIIGTLNDLAMCGAKPLYLTCGFILEEGLSTKDLIKIVTSMREVAIDEGAQIVTGDTKVIERRNGDGLFINTAGVGFIPENVSVGPKNIQEGDAIIISGDIGRHGIAIMAQREGLQFDTTIETDCMPLYKIVEAALNVTPEIHCMRDLTRGGLASALVELAETSKFNFSLDTIQVPISETVHAACEMLGLDPLFVANEGRFILFVKEQHKNEILGVIKCFPGCEQACQIGVVKNNQQNFGKVLLKTIYGGQQQLDKAPGELLPRIC